MRTQEDRAAGPDAVLRRSRAQRSGPSSRRRGVDRRPRRFLDPSSSARSRSRPATGSSRQIGALTRPSGGSERQASYRVHRESGSRELSGRLITEPAQWHLLAGRSGGGGEHTPSNLPARFLEVGIYDRIDHSREPDLLINRHQLVPQRLRRRMERNSQVILPV